MRKLEDLQPTLLFALLQDALVTIMNVQVVQLRGLRGNPVVLSCSDHESRSLDKKFWNAADSPSSNLDVAGKWLSNIRSLPS